ncbi:YdcF family protein [Mucilaginibacter ximonensis]|uniref:YdcF family protein n=1 Tax=Mucilaginibacter ximonensis TaxID=538021 RepID=A0ABW5Y9G6_9SPHI
MRYIAITLWLLLLSVVGNAQPGKGFQQRHQLLRSGNTTADKNFYLLTVFGHSAELKQVFARDTLLKAAASRKAALLRAGKSNLAGFKWSAADSLQTCLELQKLYAQHRVLFDYMINGELRPSGCYERFKNLDNLTCLLKAWVQSMAGMNHLIDQYGFSKGMRYPAVDSASYDVHSANYADMVSTMLHYLNERVKNKDLFYQPTLSVALQLMGLNNRDEPSRFEPLEKKENQAAVTKAKQTNWKSYPYSAIMVPGEGLEEGQRGISPISKIRCDLAADRYRQKKASFIIVSGGFVHPFQTPYCEAYEMKKYLMAQYHIPSSAIIMEPQARHTTTNFRNSERLMIRYGFPLSRPALCVTTKDQADYIEDSRFDQRNIKELVYVPYTDKKRLGDHELSFNIIKDCLQIDPIDPLDP